MPSSVKLILFFAIGALLGLNLVALQRIDTKSYPSEWDPRVAQLAAWVEDERDLKFDHPVPVHFLSEEDYKKEQTTDESDLTEEELRDVEIFEGQAKALGLIRSDTKLLDDINAIAAGGTLAYYDDEAEEIVIRGTEMTVGLRVTIVHELTHALQDQAFDLGREFDGDGTQSFFDGLVEGDATRIENEYIETLDDAEAEAYENESDEDLEAAGEEALEKVAPALLTFFGAPYALGEMITTLIVDEQGQDDLDKLFRTPPSSDEGLLNAFVALDGGQPVKEVAEPKLKSGEKENDSGEFGVLAWYVVLSSYVDAKTALVATDGWGGDSYVGYERDEKSCIRVAFVGDTPTDTAEMATALNAWKTAFTENTVQVTGGTDRVELDACEPKVVPAPRPDAAEALILPSARIAFVGEVLAETNRQLTECATRHFIAALPLEALTNPTEAIQQQVFDLGARVGRGCVTGELK